MFQNEFVDILWITFMSQKSTPKALNMPVSLQQTLKGQLLWPDVRSLTLATKDSMIMLLSAVSHVQSSKWAFSDFSF